MPDDREVGMKIKIVSIVAPPDAVSTAQLVGEIAVDLAKLGHEVSLLSTQPHYNHDEESTSRQPIAWQRFHLTGKSRIGASQVTHVRMSKKSGSRTGRLAQWLFFHFVAAMKLARSDADAVLVISPPPTLALLAPLRLLRPRRRVVLAIWELYPDILVPLGHVRPRGVTMRVLRLLEGATYRACDHVAFLTASMHQTATKHHPFIARRSSVVPTWADTKELCPQARPTALAEELGLAGHFVVGYGGNIGPAQDLTSLVEAAKILNESHPHIRFVICGDGTLADSLKQLAAGANNIHFTGQLSFDRVPEMYSTFNVSVVALAGDVASEALPSKFYRSLSCGVPVLGIARPGSPLDELIISLDVGQIVPPSDPTRLAETIIVMAENRDHHVLEARARATAISHFDRRQTTSKYARLLEGGNR